MHSIQCVQCVLMVNGKANIRHLVSNSTNLLSAVLGWEWHQGNHNPESKLMTMVNRKNQIQ